MPDAPVDQLKRDAAQLERAMRLGRMSGALFDIAVHMVTEYDENPFEVALAFGATLSRLCTMMQVPADLRQQMADAFRNGDDATWLPADKQAEIERLQPMLREAAQVIAARGRGDDGDR